MHNDFVCPSVCLSRHHAHISACIALTFYKQSHSNSSVESAPGSHAVGRGIESRLSSLFFFLFLFSLSLTFLPGRRRVPFTS